MMNSRAALSVFLAIFFASLSSSVSLATRDGANFDDREAVYNVTTKLVDDFTESTFGIKLKCRPRTVNILSCRLYDPTYDISYDKTTCKNMSSCFGKLELNVDNSYVGNFEIKFRGALVEQLTVSSDTSLKQLSFYRIMAGHLFLGVDLLGKNEGTYSMVEQSVYGKCETLVKIIENLRSSDVKIPHQTVSIKRTRNLETCYPVPGLLIYDAFLYHPMMASVHYDVKSSISRWVVSRYSFTSYTTEDIAVKSLEGGGNTTMLHVRTTVTQESVRKSTDPIPHIIDPVSVGLPFVDGFDPLLT